MCKTLAVVFIVCCFFLSSCDSVELDDRGIVIALGIEEDGDKLKVSAEFPDFEEDHFIVEGYGNDLNEALENIDKQIRHTIYFGHTRVCIISESILEDREKTEKILKILEENNDISGRVIMLSAANSAEDIINADVHDMTGIYISSFYDYAEDTPKVDFTDFCMDFYSGKNTMPPRVSLINGNIVIS